MSARLCGPPCPAWRPTPPCDRVYDTICQLDNMRCDRGEECVNDEDELAYLADRLVGIIQRDIDRLTLVRQLQGMRGNAGGERP